MEKKNDKQLYGIMNIIFNGVGVPDFMRGKTGDGVKKIIFGIITCGIVMCINEIKGIIEGIRILKLTDEEYMAEKYPEAPAAE